MSRTFGFSGFSSLFRAGSASAIALATILSCSDSTTGPKLSNRDPALDGITVVVFQIADSLKNPPAQASGTRIARAPNVAADVTVTQSAALTAAASSSNYTVSSVAYTPEPAPTNFLLACDDCVAYDVPLQFDFTFYGNTYNKVHVASNGLIGFDRTIGDGCCQGGGIPTPFDAPYNNMIAFAWTDLNASALNAGVRYQTQGTAPNRKFVVQWTNVPEYYQGPGRVTGQVVLSEGSNDITMYTASQNISGTYHPVTQGIENADGSLAAFLPGRVRSYFTLSNDAVRFSLPVANQAPVIAAPTNLSINTDVAACVASPKIDAPAVTDDAAGSTIAGARSDGLALDAAYPKGVTTITWTATDAGGLTATADQTVTVNDKQNPSVTAPANISARTDNHSSTATVAVGEATATDNCPDVTVSGARSDNVPLSAAFPVGVTTITWTATDAAGNTGSAAQTVTVVGNVPPVITTPANISVNTDPGVCSAIAHPGTATATDDAAGTVVNGVRSDGLPLTAAYPKGATNIEWTATDADGLTASGNQLVTVSDKEKPSILSPANISVGNDHGLASAAVLVGSPFASDNCSGVEVSALRNDGGALGSAYPVGVTTITWTAFDASGNSASAQQSVTVSDVDAPSVVVPNSFSVSASSSGGAYVNYTVTANDNVGVASVSCDRNSGSQFPLGPTLVTCVARDAAGNSGSGSFTVTVLGPDDQLGNLIEYVLSLGLPNGITNPLVNELRSAFGAPADGSGCKKMDDFISMVGKKDSGIPDVNVSYMVSEARRIEGAMGCGVASQIVSTKKPKVKKTIVTQFLRRR